jgi:hypothetical protein
VRVRWLRGDRTLVLRHGGGVAGVGSGRLGARLCHKCVKARPHRQQLLLQLCHVVAQCRRHRLCAYVRVRACVRVCVYVCVRARSAQCNVFFDLARRSLKSSQCHDFAHLSVCIWLLLLETLLATPPPTTPPGERGQPQTAWRRVSPGRFPSHPPPAAAADPSPPTPTPTPPPPPLLPYRWTASRLVPSTRSARAWPGNRNPLACPVPRTPRASRPSRPWRPRPASAAARSPRP